jgi:hypothetical protein
VLLQFIFNGITWRVLNLVKKVISGLYNKVGCSQAFEKAFIGVGAQLGTEIAMCP